MTGQPAAPAAQPATILDVLVIGAGQAGLAVGYHLRATGVRFELVERNARVGDSWRQRFESLALFTPRAYSHLPGLRMEGDQEGYASRQEVADYLAAYAARHELPVRLGRAVTRLEQAGAGFVATLSDGTTIETRVVVIASGAFAVPAIPAIASALPSTVVQLTPNTYRDPSSVPAGGVLVVGDGATGRQIALELAATHQVVMAAGKKRTLVRQRVLGRNIFWWLDHLGLLRVAPDSRIGRRLRQRDPIPRHDLRDGQLQAAGIELVPRLASFDGTSAVFANGSIRSVSSVVWATGYRDDPSWMAIPGAVGPDGAFIERRGVSPVADLFFIGRPWQMTQSSGLLTGVGADARVIAAQAVAAVHGHAPPRASDPVAADQHIA